MLISVISVILVIIGLFMASSPFYSPVRYMTTIPVTTTIVGVPTTLTATIQTKDTVRLRSGEDWVAIRIPKYKLWAWPEEIGFAIFATKVDTTSRLKTYIYYHDETYIPSNSSPRFVGHIVSDEPITFMLLDEENFMRFKEHLSYEAIYIKAFMVGSCEISFIPPPEEKIRGSWIYLLLKNEGLNPTYVSYEFKVLREVAKQYATTQYEAIETQRYELTRPETTLGIVIVLLAVILLLASFRIKPHERTLLKAN